MTHKNQPPTDDSDLDHAAVKPLTTSKHNPATCPNRPPTQEERTVSRDAWLNTKLLKLLGIIYGIASPFIIWLVVTIYRHDTELELQKLRLAHTIEKMTVIENINKKIDEINASMTKIQIDIATLKAKAGIP